MRKPVGITLGDPAGVGPEIVAKVLLDDKFRNEYPFVPVGNLDILEDAFKNILQVDPPQYEMIPIESAVLPTLPIKHGVNSAENGEICMGMIRCAVELALRGDIAAVTTPPINKRSVALAGYEFAGHTEYLGYLTNAKEYSMMLISPNYRVITATTHLPLKEVAGSLNKEIILRGIKNASLAGKLLCIESPVIAVCALNPHAGDKGVIGNEEEELIVPAINDAVNMGINASGPYPADSLFAHPERFDIAVSMYHDQGLIPIKMDSQNKGVNITLNLPIIRTSVDHGTAFDIAGRGIANPGSLKEAIVIAHKIADAKFDS